jgi:hypothetical protein
MTASVIHPKNEETEMPPAASFGFVSILEHFNQKDTKQDVRAAEALSFLCPSGEAYPLQS